MYSDYAKLLLSSSVHYYFYVDICTDNHDRPFDEYMEQQLQTVLVHTYPMTSSFRKIDIDIYDEDVLQETELYDADPRDPSQVLEEARQKQVAVRTLLNK